MRFRFRGLNDSLTRSLMATPALIMVIVLIAVPLLLSFYFSFTDWRGSGFDANVVGLETTTG